MEKLSRFRHLNKSIQRLNMIASEFIVKWCNFSFLYASYSALWWIGWYAHIEKLTMWAFVKKRVYIFNYISKNYSNVVNKYKHDDILPEPIIDSYPIWVFWGQGFENTPELVQCCYSSMIKKCKDLHAITMDNYSDYVHIPEEIVRNLNNGTITFTNFSDILRCALLAKHGGLWIDSTCWVASEIPNDVKQYSFYSIKEDCTKQQPMCSNSNWCAWALGTNEKNSKLFSFVRDIFFEHFSTHKVILDTYFIDYLILYASIEFNDVGCNLKKLPCNNEKRNHLHFLLNEQYDEDKYHSLINGNWLFKLSYKSQWIKQTEGGEQTFYGKLLENNGL